MARRRHKIWQSMDSVEGLRAALCRRTPSKDSVEGLREALRRRIPRWHMSDVLRTCPNMRIYKYDMRIYKYDIQAFDLIRSEKGHKWNITKRFVRIRINMKSIKKEIYDNYVWLMSCWRSDKFKSLYTLQNHICILVHLFFTIIRFTNCFLVFIIIIIVNSNIYNKTNNNTNNR